MTMNAAVGMSAGVRGEYRLVVKSEKTTTDTGWFDNLIVDQGLELLGDGMNSISAGIGTGTTPPSASDVSLGNLVAQSSNANTSSVTMLGAPTYGAQHTYTLKFAHGAVVGNMTEVGIFRDNSSKLFSRALIVDSNGSPVTITLTSIDELTLYYRLTLYPPLTDSTGTVKIGDIDYSYTSRILDVERFANTTAYMPKYLTSLYAAYAYGPGVSLSPITSRYLTDATGGNATVYSSGSVSTSVYALGSYNRKWNVTFGPTQGNFTGGIQGVEVDGGGAQSGAISKFQIVFDKPIPKTNEHTLKLGLKFSWARA